MRTKKVVYQDMFNPKQVFEASNKLMDLERWREFDRGLTFEAYGIKCRCMHPTFYDGTNTCNYRTCHHTEDDHY